MFGHTKFQLSISCTFKVMKVFVVYLVISTKCFITMKVQEIESWNFACPNILKRCAWRPNFSHFSWEMTKISTVPVHHRCPTFSIGDCTYLLPKLKFEKVYVPLFFLIGWLINENTGCPKLRKCVRIYDSLRCTSC